VTHRCGGFRTAEKNTIWKPCPESGGRVAHKTKNGIHAVNVDLSGNRIQDISPLFSHENQEFVDLTGHPVTRIQLKKLREFGKKVEF